ncbi:MAG: energy-coupling factor ABC transporter permease [Thiopseudomonas sp.]|nr:energy-coupling factor ABC transporter permease [Thiopseudomonas sp.]MCK9465202.1 energy-coupling factor ABC transporter permease [Thiopseudomonas sp.]
MIASMLLTELSLWIGWLLYAPLLLIAIWKTPWVELFSDSRRQHLLFGTVLVLCALWLLRRDFPSGISVHFIGMTAVTLLLGWPLAILAGLFAQLVLVAFGKPELIAVGVNGLLLVIVPVAITELAARWVERFRPENLFVYIFCSCFFPAALTAAVCAALGFLVLLSNGLFDFPPWLEDFYALVIMVIFPEAFINGTAISALVVYQPEWLETFNRSRYFQAPWKEQNSDNKP